MTDLSDWEWKAEDADLVIRPAAGTTGILSVHTASHAATGHMTKTTPLSSMVGQVLWDTERAARLQENVTRVYFCEKCICRKKAAAAAA